MVTWFLTVIAPVLVRISDKLICYYKTHLHYYSIEIRTGTAVVDRGDRKSVSEMYKQLSIYKFLILFCGHADTVKNQVTIRTVSIWKRYN